MISLKSKREIQIIQTAAEILKKIFVKVEAAVKPGVTTDELDAIASALLDRRRWTPNRPINAAAARGAKSSNQGIAGSNPLVTISAG